MSSTTDTDESAETIRVCPECGSSDWNRRQPGKFGYPNKAPNRDYWCRDCKQGFDQLAERERQHPDQNNGNQGVTDEQIEAARKALGIEVDD